MSQGVHVDPVAQLDAVIEQAKKKIQGSKESDICRYLPSQDEEGYMHHFSLQKMKKNEPNQLIMLIKKHILEGSPKTIPSKQRAPRGSRKGTSTPTFTKEELARLAKYAEAASDAELSSKILGQKVSFTKCKQDLMASIRANTLQPSCWEAYAAACKARGIQPTINNAESVE